MIRVALAAIKTTKYIPLIRAARLTGTTTVVIRVALAVIKTTKSIPLIRAARLVDQTMALDRATLGISTLWPLFGYVHQSGSGFAMAPDSGYVHLSAPSGTSTRCPSEWPLFTMAPDRA